MNKVILIGRLTGDPEVRYTTGEHAMAIARYTLAVDRKDKDKNTDFIRITAFGKGGEFAEKYLNKGMKIAVTGRIQTGSYTDKNGQRVFTTDIVADEHEFVESKKNAEQKTEKPAEQDNGWMSMVEGTLDSDEGLPWV